jgi:hypothetical protein
MAVFLSDLVAVSMEGVHVVGVFPDIHFFGKFSVKRFVKILLNLVVQ